MKKFKKPTKKVILFLQDIEEICKKYHLSISHEDGHGSFIIEKYSDYNMQWLKDAFYKINTKL